MVILQVHFNYSGGYKKEMYNECKDLAKSINNEPGFLWKIWTESEEKGLAGGVYAFDTKENAQKYITMHTERIEKFGIGKDFKYEILDVNDELSQITNFQTNK